MTTTPYAARICDLHLRPIAAVARDTTIRQAAKVMRQEDLASLVVAQPGERIAIVTERDLTGAIADGADPEGPVLDVASPDPIIVTQDAPVTDAATLMLRHSVRHLVVTRGNQAVGVVSIRDVLSVLLQAASPETVLLVLRQAALL